MTPRVKTNAELEAISSHYNRASLQSSKDVGQQFKEFCWEHNLTIYLAVDEALTEFMNHKRAQLQNKQAYDLMVKLGVYEPLPEALKNEKKDISRKGRKK